MRKRKTSIKKNASIFAIFLFVILTIYVISKMSMYVWGFYTSFKTQNELMHSTISFPKGWPWEWAWDNYSTTFANIEIPIFLPDGSSGYAVFGTLLFNTLLYTIGGTLVNAFCTWMVAYLMVRFNKIKLNALLYTVNIMLMTIPIYGTLPAALKIFKLLNWYNNYSFYFFNSVAFTGTNLLYFHAFISGLGKEYYEAAYVDGAGNFTIMMKITFPLTQGMFWVFFLTSAIANWNDYSLPIIWMPDYPTLGYALFYLTSGEGANETSAAFMPQQIAISMLLMAPLLILFFMFQDKMLGNLRIGGIKG
ncbi:MAG: carbohydrate ABC transporter permease [Clostridia bacterium]|nr:carbohydrate ABC transporter permease [Clostridia bacterium]